MEEGAIRIIARAADRTTSVDVVRLCASTLCNFAGEGRARPKMADSRTAQVTASGERGRCFCCLFDVAIHDSGDEENAVTMIASSKNWCALPSVVRYGAVEQVTYAMRDSGQACCKQGSMRCHTERSVETRRMQVLLIVSQGTKASPTITAHHDYPDH